MTWDPHGGTELIPDCHGLSTLAEIKHKYPLEKPYHPMPQIVSTAFHRKCLLRNRKDLGTGGGKPIGQESKEQPRAPETTPPREM